MCVEDSVWFGWSVIRVAGWNLQHGYRSNPTTPNLQHNAYNVVLTHNIHLTNINAEILSNAWLIYSIMVYAVVQLAEELR